MRNNGLVIPQQPTIVQQLTPFNDVQTIAWIAAQLLAGAIPERDQVQNAAKSAVVMAQAILTEAMDACGPDYMLSLQKLGAKHEQRRRQMQAEES